MCNNLFPKYPRVTFEKNTHTTIDIVVILLIVCSKCLNKTICTELRVFVYVFMFTLAAYT